MAIERTAEKPEIRTQHPDMILPLACYIVGCLASQEIIKFRTDPKLFFDDMEMATRIIVQCLQNNPIDSDSMVHIDELDERSC